MVCCKNARGGPGDEDPRPPPRLTAQQKGKAKKTTNKKRKFDDVEVKRAAAVVAAAERAERGRSNSGIHIGDRLSPAQRATVERIEAGLGSPPGTIILGGWRVSLEDALEVSRAEESQTQGVTEQQTQSVEQTENAQQGEQVEEVEQAAQPHL